MVVLKVLFSSDLSGFWSDLLRVLMIQLLFIFSVAFLSDILVFLENAWNKENNNFHFIILSDIFRHIQGYLQCSAMFKHTMILEEKLNHWFNHLYSVVPSFQFSIWSCVDFYLCFWQNFYWSVLIPRNARLYSSTILLQNAKF